ncbi:MAG TPA: hypothetical protein VGN81_28700 [Pseudonocardiaceae bacterium]|jgi:hypothetical protein
MDAAQAISLVVARIRAGELDYPTQDLTASQFHGGWCVYSPVMITDGVLVEDPEDEFDAEVTRSVFLVGESSGRVEQVESTDSEQDARDWFQEAAIWFSAQEPDSTASLATSTLPSTPDLGVVAARSPQPYDQQTLDALAQALVTEPDFAGWLAGRLGELADLLGGSSSLVARRHRSAAAEHVMELAQPEDDADDEGPTGVWRSWPPIDPARLPDVDVTGWLLVPGVVLGEFLEGFESDTAAAARLADVVADRVNNSTPWRACGVTELRPHLIALRGADLPDADLAALRQFDAGDELGTLLTALPGDADVQALLRIAVDAERQQREVIDIDAAATAAYRRVLERLQLPFENYWYEAMLE